MLAVAVDVAEIVTFEPETEVVNAKIKELLEVSYD